MYPILFIGKKQIKTDLFCANHKLHLTRPGAWESMVRLLAFPGTLLNMVESLHAGAQAAFSLFLGMLRMGLVDLGSPAGSQTWAGREQTLTSTHIHWAREQAPRRTGLLPTLPPASSDAYY